ncbi:hypothetical protein AAG570_009905 [Ranatra chinensis]|uniref:Reverse transcriptase domain-containing protein n=1 Tax=Ranatra chinensis TaxID=642074 RepID=A0ABD0YSJ5_9HEMI
MNAMAVVNGVTAPSAVEYGDEPKPVRTIELQSKRRQNFRVQLILLPSHRCPGMTAVDVPSIFHRAKVPQSVGLRGIHSMSQVLNDLSSDHSPVLLTTSLDPILKLPPPILTPGYTDWNYFAQSLDSVIDLRVPLKTPEDLDEAVQGFTLAVQRTARTSSQSPTPKYNTQSINLPQHIRLLITHKRRARSKWSDTYNSYIISLSTHDRSLWDSTKRLLRSHLTPSPLRHPDNSWARSDEDKAQLFANHLRSIFQPSPESDPIHSHQVQEYLDSPLPLTLPPSPFSPSEVTYAIQHLPRKKSPGYDLITGEILRHLPRRAILFLTYLYNAILRTTYFPLLWKFAHIKMIPKPNKLHTEPSAYRPISLLPIFSKLFEKLFLKRLVPIFESQNNIPSHQFGFRPFHSTIHQCLHIVDIISSSLEQKQYCGAAFLDVEQAFDRVWHPGLLYKLKKILPSTYYLILQSYLKDRYSVVCQKDKLSGYIRINASVPQGSVLGPLLYLIYTADIPTHPSTHMATFADDICILTSNPEPSLVSHNLQQHLNNLQKWCKKWRIVINQSKSIHITFSLRRGSCPPITFDNIPIPPASCVRYLGLYIDKRVTWNPHTRLKRIDLNRKLGLLRNLLHRRSKLSLVNKLTIYNMILKPTWTYGIELWGSARKSNIDRMLDPPRRLKRRWPRDLLVE